jgi:hypothetical protein
MEFTVDDPEGRPEVKTISFQRDRISGTPGAEVVALTNSTAVIVTIDRATAAAFSSASTMTRCRVRSSTRRSSYRIYFSYWLSEKRVSQ